MKITKLLLLSIAVILFSCSKDEDPKPTGEGLLGTWTLTGLNYYGTTTTRASGMTVEADFTGKGKDMDCTTTFEASPNTVTSQGSYIIELTTTVSGQPSTTDDYEFDEVLTDGTWELDGNTLSVTNSAGKQEATITKQTTTELEIAIDLNDTQQGSGYSITREVHAVYTLVKQ